MNLKLKRGDGFLNHYIRSLTVAAYLRCLHAAIEYAPTYTLRNQTIMNIKDPMMFRSITQLCDSTNWDESCNIGGKYLRVMRQIIKLQPKMDCEVQDTLMHYELIGLVIQKTLQKIVDKMSKDIKLDHGDKVTIYELSLTFFTVI